MEREVYRGREQTLVKHFVLQHYLERIVVRNSSFESSTKESWLSC